MNEFANTSTDTIGISEIEAFVEKMHYVSLYRNTLLRGIFPELVYSSF